MLREIKEVMKLHKIELWSTFDWPCEVILALIRTFVRATYVSWSHNRYTYNFWRMLWTFLKFQWKSYLDFLYNVKFLIRENLLQILKIIYLVCLEWVIYDFIASVDDFFFNESLYIFVYFWQFKIPCQVPLWNDKKALR